MSHYNPEPPRVGTVGRLNPYKRVDSRICKRCGARAGNCQHLKSDEDVVWLSKGSASDNAYSRWSPDEIERLKTLRSMGLGHRKIAELLNTTVGGVAGAIHRFIRTEED